MKYEFDLKDSLDKEVEETVGETIRARFVFKRYTTENWEKSNPRLLDGEIGIEYTLDGDIRVKIGNGKNHWKDLKYFNENFIISSIDNNPKIKMQSKLIAWNIILTLFTIYNLLF